MTDRVLIPLPGVGTLSLEKDAYQRALEDGARSNFSDASKPMPELHEQLLDAEKLAEILQIPVTWIEQQAREGNIPSFCFGRRRRYRRSEVEAAIQHRNHNINHL